MAATNPTVGELLRDPRLALAFGLGAGLAPRAPGTFGTLLALPLFGLLMPAGLGIYLLAVLAACLLGVPLCGYAARKLGVHDHGGIVWDEVAGALLSFIPLLLWPDRWPLWLGLATGFVLFRLFDILKPWPIGWLDRRVGGGLGIMLDDLVAGVEAGLLLALLLITVNLT